MNIERGVRASGMDSVDRNFNPKSIHLVDGGSILCEVVIWRTAWS